MWKNCKIVSTRTDVREYRAVNQDVERGSPKFVVSTSPLKEFGWCGARWKTGYKSPDSNPKKYGDLLDTLLFVPEQFEQRFAIQPDFYVNKKGERKDWRNDKRIEEVSVFHGQHAGKTIIKRTSIKADDADTDDADEKPLTLEGATLAKNQILSDAYLKKYLEASDMQVWIKGEWHDKATGIVVPCQCLVDAIPRNGTIYDSSAADLKTTRSAHWLRWPRFSLQMGYHQQGAWNLDMLNSAESRTENEQRNSWLFILSENFFPYQTARAVLGQPSEQSIGKLELGRLTYRALMARYCAALATGVWPDYSYCPSVAADGCYVDDVNKWDAERELARIENRVEEAPPEEELGTSETPS